MALPDAEETLVALRLENERLRRALDEATRASLDLEQETSTSRLQVSHIAAANAHAAETLATLEESLEEQRRLGDALAEANAHAAEVVASLEESLEEQRRLGAALAEANAHAAELMAELEEAREAEQREREALASTQRALSGELGAAVRYVTSLLPQPLSGDIRTEWQFIPSADLGGDAFGYHFVDDDTFAVYLLDVCGHGLAATLLATSVLTVLRSEKLVGADFRSPASVLAALNDTFPMARHDDTYFTIWYGVFRASTRQLRFASAGHPPALLRVADEPLVELGTDNPMIGLMPGLTFEDAARPVKPAADLFVFSDGVFEVSRADGAMSSYEEFRDALGAGAAPELEDCVRFARALRGGASLEDDYSLVRVRFA